MPSGDIATLHQMSADSRAFISGAGKLLLSFQRGSPEPASSALRHATSLQALDDHLSRAYASIHDTKIAHAVSPVIAALGRESTDLKHIATAITSHNARAGNAAVRSLRADFLKEFALARRLRAQGLTP